MQQAVPYWRQPVDLGVPAPRAGGGFNVGQALQAASMVHNLGQSIENKKRRQRTVRFMSEVLDKQLYPSLQEIEKRDLDLNLVNQLVVLNEGFRESQWRQRTEVANMTPAFAEILQKEPDPHDRWKMMHFGMERDPGMLKLVGMGIDRLAVDENGQHLMDDQGRPILPDSVLATSVARSQDILTLAKARANGINRRFTKYMDKPDFQKIIEFEAPGGPITNREEWNLVRDKPAVMALLLHHDIINGPDGKPLLTKEDLQHLRAAFTTQPLEKPSAEFNRRMSGGAGAPVGAGGTPPQPGGATIGGGTAPQALQKSEGLRQEIGLLEYEDFLNDPQGTADLFTSYATTRHEELEKEGVTGALSLAGKHLGQDLKEAGQQIIDQAGTAANAIGNFIEGIPQRAGTIARDAVRALPGGGHLVGQEPAMQPVSPSDFVAEEPAATPPATARQPSPGGPTTTEPRRNPKLDRYAGQPLSREYSMAIGRTPDQEDLIRSNYELGAARGEQKMAEQLAGEASGHQLQSLRDVERRTLDSLIEHEGFDATWRTDRHGEVIGHGLQRKNLEAMLAKTGETVPDNISRAQARQYAMRYVREVALPGARRAIGAATWDKLSPARKAVLVELAYQLGEDGLDIGGRKPGFNRMIRAIRAGDFETAARELVNSDLGRQTTSRAKALAQRLRKG